MMAGKPNLFSKRCIEVSILNVCCEKVGSFNAAIVKVILINSLTGDS
jgi:hypothetical protein